MSSVIDICNLALVHVNAARIQSITERTKSAQMCNTLYVPTRDAVLAAFPWNFAEKRVNLALLDASYSGWTYAYAYPSDCVRALEIYNPLTTVTYADGYYYNNQYLSNAVKVKAERIKFQIATNAALDRRVILTNQESAELIYTARVEDSNLYDPIFTRALAYALAAELAVALKSQPKLKEQLTGDYFRTVAAAEEGNANEAFDVPTPPSPYVTERM